MRLQVPREIRIILPAGSEHDVGLDDAATLRVRCPDHTHFEDGRMGEKGPLPTSGPEIL